MLEDKRTITCVYIPQYKDLPHLNYGIINYILNHIVHLKSPNNPERTKTPVCLSVPELREFCPRHIPDRKRYFIEPLKNTFLSLVSVGAGIGISVVADTQVYRQIPEEYRTNVTTTFIFDLGENAGDEIRDIVKGRFVSNFKQITDDYHLSSLKQIGTFIYLEHGKSRAEIRRNALVGFWYPRARTTEGETETNYYDLFLRNYPDRVVNIFGLYAMLKEINMAAQERAAEEMDQILSEEKEKKQKTRVRKGDEALDSMVAALSDLGTQKGLHLEWGPTVETLQYYQPEGAEKPVLNFSRNHILNLLKKAGAAGYLFIDKSKGRGKWKLILNQDRIERRIEELKED